MALLNGKEYNFNSLDVNIGLPSISKKDIEQVIKRMSVKKIRLPRKVKKRIRKQILKTKPE